MPNSSQIHRSRHTGLDPGMQSLRHPSPPTPAQDQDRFEYPLALARCVHSSSFFTSTISLENPLCVLRQVC
jgi:hypothetical protein